MYRQFPISEENKDVFNSKFSGLFAEDIEKFSSYGVQPFMISCEKNTLKISRDFLDQLTDIAKDDLEQLIESLR